MKIWYISKYARPNKFGMATRHFSLSKEFVRKNHETVVITSDSQPKGNFPKFKHVYNELNFNEVKTIFIRTIKFNSANSFRRIISWIDFELKLLFLNKNLLPRPDVIIISSLSLFTILTGIYFRYIYKSKLVLEIRDIWPKTIIDIGGFSPNNLFVKTLAWIEKIGYNNYDVLISTLPNFQRHVQEVLKTEKKAYFIPQGYDLEYLSGGGELPDAYINQYIPNNKFIIGYAGAIGNSNALETFFETAIEMKSNEDVHFLVLGWGDKLEHFKQITLELNNISFLPKVEKNQVQSIIKNCNILYDSVKRIDLYRFGLSRNKWIDYMYAGKPLIVSYSGYKSMINEARCGSFIEAENVVALKEKILEFKNLNPNELIEMGMRGQQWLLKNRSYSKLANEFLLLIK
jgi:hypothetical protein